jgi:hypothetical protein
MRFWPWEVTEKILILSSEGKWEGTGDCLMSPRFSRTVHKASLALPSMVIIWFSSDCNPACKTDKSPALRFLISRVMSGSCAADGIGLFTRRTPNSKPVAAGNLNLILMPSEGALKASSSHPCCSIASSSPISRSIIERPICQKAGSRASRPNGARSSVWCLVPPAESSAK